MTDDDRPIFVQMMTRLAAAYHREFDEITMTTYWDGLKDLEFLDVSAGAHEGLRTCKYLPTIAEIRQAAFRLDETASDAYKVPPRASLPPFVGHKGMAQDALALIGLICAGEVDGAFIAREMDDLERRYPGVGWATEAEKLETVLDLSEPEPAPRRKPTQESLHAWFTQRSRA